jgi:hypothetical protein
VKVREDKAIEVKQAAVDKPAVPVAAVVGVVAAIGLIIWLRRRR